MRLIKRLDDGITKWLGKPVAKPSFNKYLKEHWKVWGAIYLFNIIDAILTLWAVKLEGLHELNPVMAQVLPYPILFIGVKVAMVTLLMIVFGYLFFSQYPKLHALSVGYLFLFFLLIDINNILHIAYYYGLIGINMAWVNW